MILLGPATESYTYAILAPAVSLGLVVAFSEAMPPAPMALIALTTLMLLLAQLKSSFFSDWHSAIFNGMRPMAAVFLTVFVILWLRIDAMWKAPETTPA
jgi:hypothetical protein